MIKMKERNSKKAISPVIAVLLLIVIAVAASVITYSWINWFITLQQEQASSIIRIEETDLSLLASNGVAKIYIRNVGGTKVTVDTVYINNTKYVTEKLTLQPNELGELTAYKPLSSPNLSSGYTVEIKVTTTVGTFDIYRGIIP